MIKHKNNRLKVLRKVQSSKVKHDKHTICFQITLLVLLHMSLP